MIKYYLNSLVLLLLGILLTLCGCDKLKAKVSSLVPNKYICTGRELGNIYIERSEIDPLNIKQDEDFKHKLECTYCNQPNMISVQVELTRKIIFNDKVITENLELQKVDTGTNFYKKEIKVPEEAKTGIYFLETTIHFQDKTINRRDRFNVIPK